MKGDYGPVTMWMMLALLLAFIIGLVILVINNKFYGPILK